MNENYVPDFLLILQKSNKPAGRGSLFRPQ